MKDQALADANKALSALFPPVLPPNTTFSESDIREISDTLSRYGKQSLSRIPRIYITLRLIGHLSAIDKFLSAGITDVAFPFSKRTLPEALRSPSVQHKFLASQCSVLNKALDLERKGARHRHLASPDDTPFVKLAELGKGAYGYVDKVRSNISGREYARKLIPRGRTFRKDKSVLRDYEREIAILKKLEYRHIVQIVGSYTDPKYVGIIMSPVADGNLADFLDRDHIPPEGKSFLRTFYGCLAHSVRYLHEKEIRHKDIKPQNILIKGHQVFLTDFGISLDWSDLSRSTTTGPSSKTARYCAPEVAADEPRNCASDIWSLGCVFLEIWAALCGQRPTKVAKHMEKHGTCSVSYHSNLAAVVAWCENIAATGKDDRQAPLEWIQAMMKAKRSTRLSARMLCDLIEEVNDDPDTSFSFVGRCCTEDDVSSESVQSDDECDIPLTSVPNLPEVATTWQPTLDPSPAVSPAVWTVPIPQQSLDAPPLNRVTPYLYDQGNESPSTIPDVEQPSALIRFHDPYRPVSPDGLHYTFSYRNSPAKPTPFDRDVTPEDTYINHDIVFDNFGPRSQFETGVEKHCSPSLITANITANSHPRYGSIPFTTHTTADRDAYYKSTPYTAHATVNSEPHYAIHPSHRNTIANSKQYYEHNPFDTNTTTHGVQYHGSSQEYEKSSSLFEVSRPESLF